MLEITVTIEPEQWDEKNERFIPPKETTLQLEHSLVSLSKWESKYHKPFLTSEKTDVETLEYIKFMTLTQNIRPDIYNYLSRKNIKEIEEYINDPMTATTFREDNPNKKSRQIITNELIYSWMVGYQIPFECQSWHLNRLITLIRVCGAQNQPPKKGKTSQKDLASKYAAMNARNRAKYNSKG